MRRAMPIFIVAFVLAVAQFVIAQATQPPQPPQPPNISPEAQAMLDQIRDAYAKVATLELAGTFSMDMDVAGEQQKQSAAFTASFESPNKFRHEMKDDAIAVSTGEKLFSVLVSRNQYISAEAPAERTSSLAGGVGDLLKEQNPSLVLALSQDARAEL